MITLLYNLLLIFLLFFMFWNLLEEKTLFKQANLFLIIIPFLLRILSIR